MSCSKKRKQECTPPCQWIKGKGCKNPIQSPKTPCYKKRKPECTPPCQWITGKGCKNDKTPIVQIEPCHKKRKPQCTSPCQWIVGNGCIDILSPVQNKLLSGRNLLSIEKILDLWKNVKVPPYWKDISDPYWHNTALYFQYLQNKYGSKQGVEFLCVDNQNNGNFVDGDIVILIDGFKPNLIKSLIDPDVNIIVIGLCITGKKIEDSHQVVFFINKVLKTVEYYDPNGFDYYKLKKYEFLKKGYNTFVKYLKEVLESCNLLTKYKILPISKSNLRLGLQVYGDCLEKFVPEQFYEWGFCAVFSIIIIHYRIQYIKLPIVELQHNLFERITSPAIDAEDGFLAQQLVATFLLNYLMFIAEKASGPQFNNPYIDRTLPYSFIKH